MYMTLLYPPQCMTQRVWLNNNLAVMTIPTLRTTTLADDEGHSDVPLDVLRSGDNAPRQVTFTGPICPDNSPDGTDGWLPEATN
jgi:hypothetical protein